MKDGLKKLTINMPEYLIQAAKSHVEIKGDSLSGFITSLVQASIDMHKYRKIIKGKDRKKDILDELYGSIKLPDFNEEDCRDAKLKHLLEEGN